MTNKGLSFSMAAVLASGMLLSQVSNAATAAAVNGVVRSADGDAISGAQVSIVHDPSGTVAQATTGDSGVFYQGGLRVGGPYSVTVTASGYADAAVSEIVLKPGPQVLPAITIDRGDMEEVVVTESRQALDTMLNNGVGSAYNSEDLANQPSVNRDILRTVLRDPLAHSTGEGNLSVAGVNPRFNGLAIDGSLQQDDFGLSDNTYATARSPINLDAIESISLVASDYSVEASGFTGGLVNVTTKSGENEWDGSAFYYFQNEGMIGDTYDGDRSFNPGDFDEKEFGLTLGGPIMQDTLFAFVSIDKFESTSTADFSQFDASRGIQPGFFEALRGVIRDVYGYDPGGRPDVAATPVSSERVLLKVDWNINDAHRASLTHQVTQETGTSVSSSRFTSAWIDTPVDLDSTTLQVFSDWNAQTSTSIRINNKNFERGQDCKAGPGVGMMELDNIRGSSLAGTPLEGLLTGTVDLTAGCDRFRHANAYNDQRLQISATLDYVLDRHLLQVGIEHEAFDLYNLFVPSSAGRFLFSGYEGLTSRVARVDYVNTKSNVATDGAATWGFTKQVFTFEDNYQLSDNIEVTGGIRYEQYSQSDRPTYSNTIEADYGIRSDTNLDGLTILLPRFSFRYTGDNDMNISGGIGLYSGGDPKVWTSNAFQVPTVFTRGYNVQNVSPLSVPENLRQNVANAPSAVPIDIISPDFEIPSDWKASLHIDKTFDLDYGDIQLGRDYTVSFQYLYTATNAGFLWTNLAQTSLAATQPTGTAPDGRVIYADLDRMDILNLTELGNHNDGASHVWSISLEKAYDIGLDFAVSYAAQSIEIGSEGFSSRGISNWRNIQDLDRNNPSPRPSPHEVKQAFKANLGYEHTFAGFTGRVDLFGRATTGSKYTFTFDTHWSNALFGRAGAGEGPYDNSPLYIPSSERDDKVVYASGFDVSGFFDYVKANNIPAGVAEPYGENAPFNHQWDLRFQVTMPGMSFLEDYVGENNVKVVFDIENVLNFLNEDWGVYNFGPRYNQAAIIRADLVDVDDVEALGVDGAPALTGDLPRERCTSENACVYRFTRFTPLSLEFPNGTRSVYEIRLGIRIDI